MKKKFLAVTLATVLALSLGLVMAGPTEADPGLGIVGIWHLDDVSGTNAEDDSGNDNDGTLDVGSLGNTDANAAWVSDLWGGTALNFDGIDDYVDVGDDDNLSVDLAGAVIVEAWIKPNALPANECIAGKWSDNVREYVLKVYSGKVRFYADSSDLGTLHAESSTTLISGQWYHVAGIWDGSNLYVCINGSVDGSPKPYASAGLSNTIARFTIGAQYWNSAWQNHFSGEIDEVRIWDTATPSFNFDAEPEEDVNPLMDNHEIYATVTIERTDAGEEPAPGEKIYFDVTNGPNIGDNGSGFTQSDGIATLSYTGDGVGGTDTINVWKDQNCNGTFDADIDYEDEVEKEWCIWCTDDPEYDQVKVAQVPFPWQFWEVVEETDVPTIIIDKIRMSPTWLEPPDDQPAGDGGVWVRRWWTTLETPLPLEELVWQDGVFPSPDWLYDRDPQMIEDGDPSTPLEDLSLEIPIEPVDGAVLVAYEVMPEDPDNPGEPGEASGHFINEAILESNSPQQIVRVLVNFDVHNNTNWDVTNFELDFWGINFDCAAVIKAIGFEVRSGESWGASCDYPLIVRPIDGGTEVKWVEPCRPLANYEWLHGGLEFVLPDLIDGVIEDTEPILITAQGYWTIIIPIPPDVWCIEAVNPHGKTIPPAGWSTLPGPKGGQNDEGFYQLFAEDYLCREDVPNGLPQPTIFVGYEDNDGNFVPVAPGNDLTQLGYSSGTVVKITEAKGSKAGSFKKIGSTNNIKGKAGAVTSHITLPSDPVIIAIDAAGNRSTCDECLVPPKPK